MGPGGNYQTSGPWGYDTGLEGDQDYLPFASTSQGYNQQSFAQNRSSMPTINNNSSNDMDASPAGTSSPASQSGQTAPNKVQLNARAAELKEKLRKRRELQEHGGNTVDHSGDTSNGSTVVDGKEHKPGQITSFVPHPLPQPVSQPILPATGEDIAALISDIRSATNPELAAQPATASNEGNGASIDKPAATLKQEAAKSNGPPTDKPAATLKQETAKSSGPDEPEEGEITEKTPALKNKILPMRETAKQGEPAVLSLPPKPKVDQDMNRPMSFFKKKAPSPSKQTDTHNKATATVQRATPAYRPASAGSQDSRSGHQAALTGGPKKTTPQEPSVPDRMEAKTSIVETASKVVQAPVNPSGSKTRNGSLLGRVLAEDNDLRDWLEMTHYHNNANRANRLARWRRLMELEKEKQEILRQEELESRFGREPTMLFPLPTATSATGLDSTSAMQLDTTPVQIQPTQMTTDLSSKPAAAWEAVTTAASTQPELQRLKREHRDDDMVPQRPEKQPRTGEEGSFTKDGTRPESSHSNRSRGHRGTYRGGHGGSSRQRSPPSSYYENSYRRSASRERSPHHRPTGQSSYRRRSDLDFHEHQDSSPRHENYRDDRDRHRDRGQQGHRSKHNAIDLGYPGETRFFMVKSFNTVNVMACMDDGLWTTQLQNQEMLTSAFAQCKNVILFFSVNQSRAFQGYARMATAPSPDTPAPKWMRHLHWESSPPFRVEWLCKTEMPFHAVHHLVNVLNEGRSVIVGKDGQEIESQCGRDLLAEMDGLEESKRSGRLLQQPPPGPRHSGSDEHHTGGSPPPYRARGGYRGRGDRGRGIRGRGRGRPYVKREGSPL